MYYRRIGRRRRLDDREGGRRGRSRSRSGRSHSGRSVGPASVGGRSGWDSEPDQVRDAYQESIDLLRAREVASNRWRWRAFVAAWTLVTLAAHFGVIGTFLFFRVPFSFEKACSPQPISLSCFGFMATILSLLETTLLLIFCAFLANLNLTRRWLLYMVLQLRPRHQGIA